MRRLSVLGLVPARGGSKGVPRKNIRPLAGRPLLAYTAESARRSKRLTRVVLSTEDEEIARVGTELGLDVPFLRPMDLAGDTTPTLPVVQHAIQTLEQRGERFDAVCLLQPTDPLRSADDIDACIELLERTGADSVISILEVPDRYNPYWTFFMHDDHRLQLALGGPEPISRRQALPPAFHRSGSIYLTRCDVVLSGSLYGGHVVGWQAPADRAVNIDAEEDFVLAERILIESRGRA